MIAADAKAARIAILRTGNKSGIANIAGFVDK
jgi:hypothetical protein